MKKRMFLSVLSILFLTFAFIGCQTQQTTYTLPDLSGMTETEAREELSSLLVTIVVKTEQNYNVETGDFSRYGNDLAAGSEITPGTVLTLYFAENPPVLPDLSGKTSSEIREIMDNLGIDYQITIETNNEVPDQTFSRYGNPYEIGDMITDSSTTVLVYIGYNDPVLPDLSGKTIGEIETILESDLLGYTFVYIVDDTKTEDVFASYGDDYEAGDFFSGTVVTVNLYKNTFTSAEKSLMISQYVDGGNDTDNQAIELYNPTDAAIDLQYYHITIYQNGSYTATYTIPLPIYSLAVGETYVIVYSEADADLLAKADLTTDKLSFDGNDCIQLCYENGTFIDTIYAVGNTSFIMDDEVFIRDESIVVGTRTYDVDEWVAYIPSYTEKLGIHPVSTPTVLEFIYVDRSFLDPLGGMDLVTLAYTVDGDTAAFTPGFLDNQRVRFLGVDTPESYKEDGEPDPWGPEAKEYTDSVLEAGTIIYIQSDPALGFYETYGRSLGFVWVDGVLLNYELVRLGYSYNYLGSDCTLIYGNRYLYRWFQDAEKEAQANSRGLFS